MSTQVPTYGLYGEQTSQSPDFWIHCETIAARSSAYRWEIGLHRHENFIQLLYICEGVGDAILESGRVPLTPPCIMLMPPRVSHGYRFSHDVKGIVITAVADHPRIAADDHLRVATSLKDPQLVSLRAHGDPDYLEATINRIAEEFEARRLDGDDLIQLHLATSLMLLGRLAAPRDRMLGDPRQAKVQALVEMIVRSFRARLPVAEYARRLNMSPTHLNRVAREVTGSTVHDLIMSRVMDEARRALVFTPATIQQISGDLGFADAGYFTRCFRKRTGWTPGAFRRAERQRLNGSASSNDDSAEIVDIGTRRASEEEVADRFEPGVAVVAGQEGSSVDA